MDVDVEFRFPWEDGAKTAATDYELDSESDELVEGDGKGALPSCFVRNWFAKGSTGFKFSVIEPFSRLSNIWSMLVLLTFAYNLWYVPISIAFEYKITSTGFFILDWFAILIYALDIPFKLNKAVLDEYGNVETDLQRIRQRYMRTGLFTDFLSTLPLDYFTFAAPAHVSAWLRILRLVKISEIHSVLLELTRYSRTSLTLFNLFVYFILFIYLTHFAACFLFFIGRV
jgi:hypothetical protein